MVIEISFETIHSSMIQGTSKFFCGSSFESLCDCSSKGPEEGLDLDKLVSVEEILNIVAWDSWCCDFFSPLCRLLLSIILLLT